MDTPKWSRTPSIWSKVLNDVTKPIIFVAVLTVLFAYFSDFITKMDVIVQFLVVGVPLAFIVFYYFGKLHDGLMYTLALFIGALSWDLVMPPYAVDLAGNINTQVFLSGTATDTFFGTIWHGLGFTGFPLFVMTYPVTFGILFVLATFLVKLAKKRS